MDICGFTSEYIVAKIVERSRALDLDLSGLHVLTEAATAAYSATPVIAAFAGAEVVAKAKDSRFGPVAQIRRETESLAAALGLNHRITIVEAVSDAQIAAADIVTNSGHLRPLDRRIIEKMKPGAVIPLMYEAWELRAADVDLEACRRRGTPVAGTNERFPAVGVFEYLGLVVVKAALGAGFSLLGDRCLVLSDNDFGAYVARAMRSNGAIVDVARSRDEAASDDWDIVVIAATPPLAGGKLVSLGNLRASLYCQLWGDADRTGASGRWLPPREPSPGHMGLTIESLGPMPVLRLQAGGLKCAEVMLRGGGGNYADIVQWVEGFPCGVSP